jgi:hypothetical protein
VYGLRFITVKINSGTLAKSHHDEPGCTVMVLSNIIEFKTTDNNNKELSAF